jgi:probable rRNA maturation factor
VRRGARAPASRIAAGGGLAGIAGASRLARDLRALAAQAARLARRPVRLDLLFTTDAGIRGVHRRWLGADSPTDVVSFPLSAPGDPVLVGALVVSRDTARREAARRGHSPYHEVMLYVVHGTLHLVGHDDHGRGPRARMRRAERRVLAAMGLPCVFGREEAR